MNTIYVGTFQDLLGDYDRCEIINPIGGNVVRIVKREGDKAVIDAITVTVTVPLNTELRYEPWVFDRGNLLFSCPGYGHRAKFCTEGDIVRYEDGTEAGVLPAVARN